MENSSKVANCREPSHLICNNWNISTKMPKEIVKNEGDYLIHSELDIKIEEGETVLPVMENTCFKMCPNYDIKHETGESMVKLEDLHDEMIKNPMDVSCEIEVAVEGKPKQFSSEDEIKIKNEESSDEEYNLIIDIEPESPEKEKSNNKNDKIFTEKGELKKPLTRIHTGEKPFQCHICKNSFNRKYILDRHMLTHTGEKSYVCNICKKVFSRKQTLNDHKLIHSGVKQYSCNQCNDSFRQKNALVRHKLVHTGDKPFICNLCNKAFTQKIHLTEHRRHHTKEKPFTCEICNKSFTQKSHLTRHKKIHKNK